MQIKYCSYPTAFFKPGGGETQLLKTLEGVQALGFNASLLDCWDPFSDGDIDALHIFSVCAGVEGYIDICRAMGIKIIVSPILWPEPMAEVERTRIRHILINSDLILPNSQAEINRIKEFFAVEDKGQFSPVFNACQHDIFNLSVRNDYVVEQDIFVCIANIDIRKNIHIMLEACERLGVRVLLAGSIRDMKYFNSLIDKFAHVFDYVGQVVNGSQEHLDLLRRARGFVLPSLCETPGIAALEAVSCGVPIVITTGGATKEYFSDVANYFNPDSVDELTKALSVCLDGPTSLSPSIVDRFSQFNWLNAAKQCISGYRKL